MGYRHRNDGTIHSAGSYGTYWSSTVDDTYSLSLDFNSGYLASMLSSYRASGCSVRCLKD